MQWRPFSFEVLAVGTSWEPCLLAAAQASWPARPTTPGRRRRWQRPRRLAAPAATAMVDRKDTYESAFGRAAEVTTACRSMD